MKRPLLVGITGGIGAGKSVVCKIFQTLGTPVYDADSQAKRLMHESPVLKKGIIALFGPESFKKETLDREWIGSAAFHNPDLLSKLNALVHPEVAKDFENWCKVHSDVPYVLKEAALLFETGSYKQFDHTILVTAPLNVRIDRVTKRDTHRSRETIEAIIAKQLSDEHKTKLADSIIENDGESLLIPQILKLHEQFLQK